MTIFQIHKSVNCCVDLSFQRGTFLRLSRLAELGSLYQLFVDLRIQAAYLLPVCHSLRNWRVVQCPFNFFHGNHLDSHTASGLYFSKGGLL